MVSYRQDDENRQSGRKGPMERSARHETTEHLVRESVVGRDRPIRMLRLAQVIDMTGLGKTKIYELQAEGSFPMRVKITAHSVGWIEDEVQAWLTRRVQISARFPASSCHGFRHSAYQVHRRRIVLHYVDSHLS